jgi:hypothetical protein
MEFDVGHLLTAYSPFAERHICATLHLMPVHHYLPATYLASFSKNLSLPRRDRVIAVGDKRSKRVFSASAARVGAIRDFYTLVSALKDDPQLLEKIWAQYETDLADAVERLVSRSPDALTWAHRFIFGPDELTVTRHLGHGRGSPSRVPEPYDLGFISGPLAMVHEFTWHRLVGVLAKPPDHEDAWKFDLDWKAIASGWKPVAIIPSWGPRVMFDLPPALRREGDVIYVGFYDVEGLTTPPTDESREAR